MRQMMHDAGAAPVLAETHEKLRRHGFDSSYVDVIGQPDPRAGWPMEQAAAFLHVHSALNSGRFARVDIELHEEPGSDRGGREANAAVVGDLPSPFVGWVDTAQNCSPTGDGSVSWAEPIWTRRSTGFGSTDADGATTAISEDFQIRPYGTNGSGVPLEIGSTKASVTAAHLARFRGVARWPYGSTVMTILLDTTAIGAAAGTQDRLPL